MLKKHDMNPQPVEKILVTTLRWTAGISVQSYKPKIPLHIHLTAEAKLT